MITEDASRRLHRAFETLLREVPDHHLTPLDSQATADREFFEDADGARFAPDSWDAKEPPTIDDFPW